MVRQCGPDIVEIALDTFAFHAGRRMGEGLSRPGHGIAVRSHPPLAEAGKQRRGDVGDAKIKPGIVLRKEADEASYRTRNLAR